jgi:hypothetical protein
MDSATVSAAIASISNLKFRKEKALATLFSPALQAGLFFYENSLGSVEIVSVRMNVKMAVSFPIAPSLALLSSCKQVN